MKISDFVEDTSNVSELNEALDLEEVEKTAELLDAFSEEDTLLDDLAKLAVLQDIVGQNQVELEKQGYRAFGLGRKTETQAAKATRRAANKKVRIREIQNDTAKLNAEADELARRSKKLSGNADDSPMLDSVVPFIVGGGVAAAGTAYYMKNKNDKKINEIARYYEGVQPNNK